MTENKKNMIKALRCMASKNPEWETCYKDKYPDMVCATPVREGVRGCPYFQLSLQVPFVDGDASWTGEAADTIEELEAIKKYIKHKMEADGIPTWAYGAYNDVLVFMREFERVKERENEKNT